MSAGPSGSTIENVRILRRSLHIKAHPTYKINHLA